MNFKETQELSNKIEYPHLLSVNDVVWGKFDGATYWIEGKDVYSAYMTEGFHKQEDMYIFNGDTQMGYWMTYIFPLSKEISYGEFEDKYGEFM